MVKVAGAKDKVRRKFVNSFARQYLNDYGIRMYAGNKPILTPIGEKLYNIKLPNTMYYIGEQFAEQGEIKKLTSYEELKSLGFVIISINLNQTTRWETGQKVQYELRRADETGEHLNKIPKDHYVEFDGSNGAIRLMGPRSGRLNFGPWVMIKKKKQYHGGGSEKHIKNYVRDADDILEKQYNKWMNIEDEAKPVHIKEAAFMITNANEIVCLPNVQDMPSIIISGMKGSGKCIVQDEDKDFIIDGEGNHVKIKDRPKEVYCVGKDLKFKKAKINNYFNRRVKKVIEITTKTGRSIKVTPEHPFLTVLGWKKASDLTKEDFVGVLGNLKLENQKYLKRHEIMLLAYALTRGRLERGKLVFPRHRLYDINKEIDDSLEKLDHNLYRTQKHLVRSKSKKNKLLKFLKRHNLVGKSNREKIIPNFIMSASEKSIKHFLNDIFTYNGELVCEVSKTAHKQGFLFRCPNVAYANQVKHLLSRFGIQSYNIRMATGTTKEGRNKKHLGVIYLQSYDSQNYKKFLEIFEPRLKAHKKRLAIEKRYVYGKQKTSSYMVYPKEIFKLAKPADWKKVSQKLGWSVGHNFPFKGGFNVAIPTFKKIAEASDNKLLKMHANSDIFWDRIKSIKKIEGNFKVWDIEVDDDTHNFVANDFIVHNSFAVHSIISRLFWKPAFDYKIAILNDSSRETGTWNLPNQDIDQINILKRLNERPLPLPCVYLHPLVRENYEKLFMGDVGFDVTIPFKEIVDNHKEYLNLKESARYFTKIAAELRNCKTQKEAQSLFDDLILHFQIPPQTANKIRAEFDTLFDSKMTDISTEGQAPWSTSKRKGKIFNPLTASLHAGVLPVLETEFVSNYRQLLSIYFTYFVKDIFNRQKQDPDFLEEKSEVLLVIDEAHNISQKGLITGADRLLRRCVREGRPRRLGTLLATQKFNELPDVIKDNTTYLICFKNVGEASEIVNQYNMGKHMVNTIRDLGKHECIAYTTEHFVVYDSNGNKRKSKLNEVFIGKTLPPYSQHKKPNA
jgi:intein/homing endonuclease